MNRITANKILEEHWAIDPKWTLGAGIRDYSQARKHAIITVSNLIEVATTDEYQRPKTFRDKEFWQKILKQLKEMKSTKVRFMG